MADFEKSAHLLESDQDNTSMSDKDIESSNLSKKNRTNKYKKRNSVAPLDDKCLLFTADNNETTPFSHRVCSYVARSTSITYDANAPGKLLNGLPGSTQESSWSHNNMIRAESYPQSLLLLGGTARYEDKLITLFTQYYSDDSGRPKLTGPLDLKYINKCLENGIDINHEDSLGQTILMEAARSWDVDVVRFLLEKGADPNHFDSLGRSVIHTASAGNRQKVLELLLSKGALINARTEFSNETALHLAARRGMLRSLESLLNHDAETELCDYRGRTPLFTAAENGHQEAVRLLLNAGASVDIMDHDDRSLFVQMVMSAPIYMDRALSRLMVIDKQTSKTVVNAEALETSPRGWYKQIKTSCLLDLIESEEIDAVRHCVIQSIVQKRWDKFGKTWGYFNFVCRALVFIIWSSWIVSTDWERKHIYKWPDDSWRVILPTIGLIVTAWEIKIECSEFFYSIRRGVVMAKLNLDRIQDDMKLLAHPSWPQEYEKFQIHFDETEKKTKWWHQTYQYHKDLWNIYDLIVFACLIACVITHIADIIYTSFFTSRLHSQLGCIVILLLGIRLMKEARGFIFLGELVIMIGLMAADFARFIFLYLQLYIPFTMAFWVVFGGERFPYKQRNCRFICPSSNETNRVNFKSVQGWTSEFDTCDTNCSLISVNGMSTYTHLCFSLFRITLLDEYDFETMVKIDPTFTYILLSAFLITSAIVGINFLIGLISNALGDGAKQYVEKHTLLQRIRAINLIEQSRYCCPPIPSKCQRQIMKEAKRVEITGATEFVFTLPVRETTIEIKKQIREMRKQVDVTVKKVRDIHTKQDDLDRKVESIRIFIISPDTGNLQT